MHSSTAPTQLKTEMAIRAVFISSGVRDYLRVLPMSHALGTLPCFNIVARIYSALLYSLHTEPDFITNFINYTENLNANESRSRCLLNEANRLYPDTFCKIPCTGFPRLPIQLNLFTSTFKRLYLLIYRLCVIPINFTLFGLVFSNNASTNNYSS